MPNSNVNNNWLFVVSVIVVFCLLVGLNFEALDDYIKWYIPLTKINHAETHYADTHGVYFDIGILDGLVSNVEYVDADRVKITFGVRNQFVSDYYDVPSDFEHTAFVKKNDVFISKCFYWDKSDDTAAFSLHRLFEITNTTASFDHYFGDLPEEMECRSDKIIKSSFDVYFDIDDEIPKRWHIRPLNGSDLSE